MLCENVNGKSNQSNFFLREAFMYERFTDRARKVMALANQEAQRFNHEYIGTEHILLGLLKEGSGVGATVLMNLNVDRRKIRREVEKLLTSGPDMVTMGKLPPTPRAKKVIEYAIEEARALNSKYVGTEHILLGLLRVPEGIAAQVLMNLGLKLEDVRQAVINLVSYNPQITPEEAFADDLLEACKISIIRLRYHPAALLQMVAEKGAVAAAKHFLNSPEPTPDFTKMCELKRMDLTVEAKVLDPHHQLLFTHEEIEIARKRISDYGH
jgi:ATP-dependent Clp protease ATP-binding subunit ClpA